MEKIDLISFARTNYGNLDLSNDNYGNENSSIENLFEMYSNEKYKAGNKNKKFVFKVLYTLKNNNKIDDFILKILTDYNLSKSNFNINFKVLEKEYSKIKDKKGYYRYYKDMKFNFNNSEYYVCSQWTEQMISNLAKFASKLMITN